MTTGGDSLRDYCIKRVFEFGPGLVIALVLLWIFRDLAKDEVAEFLRQQRYHLEQSDRWLEMMREQNKTLKQQ